MSFRSFSIALAIVLAAPAATVQAADVLVRSQPVAATARLATEGIGYSVVQQRAGVAAGPYRVLLACTVAWRNASALCPTPAHDAYCRSDARIVCR